MATAVAAANAVAACPDGNEVESGMDMSGWIDDSATGGRARSVTSLSSATETAAAPAAMLADSAQTRVQRRRASPTAPNAAMSGHFTHQADATTNTPVSGSQRRVWVASMARLSSSAREWSTVGLRW